MYIISILDPNVRRLLIIIYELQTKCFQCKNCKKELQKRIRMNETEFKGTKVSKKAFNEIRNFLCDSANTRRLFLCAAALQL